MQTDTSVLKLDINLIIPNKYQPRKVFDEKSLDSLSESIKKYGIINPILVRKNTDKYEIIAGERRYRAARQAGLTEVPVIIKNANEQEMAEIALIENIQRQSLNPIEEAKSYEEIMKIGNQTQISLAEKLGKSQSSIANKIRLLSLPIEVQDALTNKKISERHARTLITVKDNEKQLELLERIIKEKLTVKELEQIINEKDITEEEIKQAISEIMKSLNITEEEKEEKEDDNMNNGNFFPNFDNNNAANNNASLNMMNMQSMNQAPIVPEQEMVMPTIVNPTKEQLMNNSLQFVTPEPMAQEANMNDSIKPIDSFIVGQNNNYPQVNSMTQTMEPSVMYDAPLFTPPVQESTYPTEPQMVTPETPVTTPPIVDVPLFNPNVIMPSLEQPIMAPTGFEVPVTNKDQFISPQVDKITELKNLLTSKGYNYKVYSNETDDCVIIELPRN